MAGAFASVLPCPTGPGAPSALQCRSHKAIDRVDRTDSSKNLRLVVHLLLFSALAAPAWSQEIRLAEVHSVPTTALPGAEGASHQLRLSLYGFRGTRWTSGEIVQAVLASAPLLGQCGVSFAAVELRMLESPRRFHFYFTPVSRELLREIAVSKPALFFVDDTQNRPAFDAEAIGRNNAATRPELADTVWVAYGARDLPQVIAHELVHVLSDSGAHSDEAGNLMQSDTAAQDTRLSAAQCGRLRARGEANGLLTPR